MRIRTVSAIHCDFNEPIKAFKFIQGVSLIIGYCAASDTMTENMSFDLVLKSFKAWFYGCRILLIRTFDLILKRWYLGLKNWV